jgi:4-hydroxy-tetrahydrodipicolinate reductase
LNLIKKLATLVGNYKDYNINIEEIHHKQKLDRPSGTAITLADEIITNSKYSEWSFDKNNKDTIKMISKREDNIPGTHSVQYNSLIDSLEIKHTAHNRKGFALGAVIAAEWILNKKGVFNMSDVIKDTNFKF